MILLCEPYFTEGGHVPFNAGLLSTIHATFPKEDLVFCGAAAHIEELKKQVGESLARSIVWDEIDLPALDTVYWRRFRLELSLIRRLLTSVFHDSTSRLVLTSACPSTVLALKLARLLESSKLPVQVVLHGMVGVIGKRRRHPIHRFQDMKTALTLLGNNNVQYLVLEQSIRDTALRHLPVLSDKIEALDHPISPQDSDFESAGLSEPIRFGFLGLADKPKGFPLFVQLANHTVKKYGRRVEFHVIGRLPKGGTHVNGAEVLTTKPEDKRMSRTDFIRGVMPLHYIVLPHEAASYTLAASGVLLDAVMWEKPVIARRIPIFEAVFEKHGDIGYLFSNDEELKNITEQILQTTDKSRYRVQTLNLRSVRKSRDPETLAASYRDICMRSR